MRSFSLLFILVMDSLSTKICNAVNKGHFRGIKLYFRKDISHKFFVDDVLMFGLLDRTVWQNFFAIFNSFCSASGMEANKGKYCIYFEEEGKEVAMEIENMFN